MLGGGGGGVMMGITSFLDVWWVVFLGWLFSDLILLEVSQTKM